MNVLVVEDNPTDSKLLQLVLEAEGHRVAVARTAEEALALVHAGTTQIIVTDLALPRMDGTALARELKASPATAAIPVVAVTAYTDRFPPRETQRAAGFAAFLVKPLDFDALPALLASLT